mgnify:CR=1 FL=1
MRKIAHSFVFVIAMMLLTSGCGQVNSGQAKVAGTAEASATSNSTAAATDSTENTEKEVIPEGKTVVNFWHSMTSGVNNEAIKKIVDNFNKTNTENIYVKQTPQGSYNDCSAKLMQAIAANNNPEICMLDRALIPQYAPLNALEDLTPYAEKDKVDIDDFISGLMAFSKVDGKLLSLPFNRSTPVFYWNKTAFKEVGLDPDTPPTTYDELYQYAEKLTKVENGKTIRYGFEMIIDSGWYLMGMIQQQGKKMLSDDGQKVLFTEDGSGLKALTYWKEFRDSGYCKIPETTDAGTAQLQNFYQGKLAMIYASTGSLAAVIKNTEAAGTFDVGVGYMMKFDTQSCPTGGANLVLLSNSKSEKKQPAWNFLKFATNTENAAQWSVDTGYVPTRKSAAETEIIKSLWKEHPQYQIAYDQLEYANDTCYGQYFWEYNTMMNKIVSTLIQDGKITPEEAIQQMKDEAARLFPGNKS